MSGRSEKEVAILNALLTAGFDHVRKQLDAADTGYFGLARIYEVPDDPLAQPKWQDLKWEDVFGKLEEKT